MTQVTADKIVIACGSRPAYPGIPGDKEHGITSDDLFSLKEAPGKTLVVGGNSIALECAGFLAALGYDITVMTNSDLLPGFDQGMSERIVKNMEARSTKVLRGAAPAKLDRASA